MPVKSATRAKQDEKQLSFYTSLSQKPRTIEDLTLMHRVSRATAYKWLKIANVVQIPDTWPRQYSLVNGVRVEDAIPYGTPKEAANSQVNSKAVQEIVDLLEDSNAKVIIDLKQKIEALKSVADADKLINALLTTVEVVRYYRTQLEGLD